MATGGTVVVLGARGGIGAAVVDELAKRGAPVRAVVRSTGWDQREGVEQVAADLTKIDEVKIAIAGASVVHMCAQPAYNRWTEEFPPLLEGIIDAVAEAAPDATLVFADNLYMYGPAKGPLTETTPMLAASRKGRVRVRLNDMLFASHTGARIKATAGRASDYFGAGGTGSVIGRALPEVVAGKNAPWFGRADVPRSFSYLPDIARGLADLGGNPVAIGRAWHIPPAPPVTADEFFRLAYAAAGTTGRVKVMGRLMLRIGGLFVPDAKELIEMLDQFDRPFVSDGSAWQRELGAFQATPHAEALKATVAWWQQQADAKGKEKSTSTEATASK